MGYGSKLELLLTNGLREAYAEIFFLLSVCFIENRQTSEISEKLRLLKEVCGFLFGISMNFKLAPLQYVQNMQRKKQLTPSCLRNKFPPKSLRQLTQPRFWLTTQLILLT